MKCLTQKMGRTTKCDDPPQLACFICFVKNLLVSFLLMSTFAYLKLAFFFGMGLKVVVPFNTELDGHQNSVSWTLFCLCQSHS